MIEGFAAAARGLDEEVELLAHLGLADVLGQALGAQCPLEGIFGARGRADEPRLGRRSGKGVGFDGHGGVAPANP